MSVVVSEMKVRQEVRFAIVLYGGVSLAIYINGVTQELFRMVRATAEDPKNGSVPLVREFERPEESGDKQIKGTEKVYRRIGQLLGGDAGKEEWYRPRDRDPIRTRFVVDILSGTSAGGINAVYLAKALANDQPLEQIQNLWIEEGDIEKLINDRKSIKGLGFGAQNPPKSLLNSQRMYHKLQEALEGMEEEKPSIRGATSPYAKELDLFVTATDISGQPVYFRLSGGIAQEKIHRNVFHFRYSENGDNDFLAENNPFLAFAARCTSAFPFAFEPMKLADINRVLPRQFTEEDFKKDWEKFFPNYRKNPSAPDQNGYVPAFYERDFGDGGYLDNKPFGYATEALASRRSGLPVRRKLMYVEPTPEKFENQKPENGNDRLNAIENVRAALSLARYETIREDMQRILKRNRLNERARNIVSGMEKDFQQWKERPRESASGSDYVGMGLEGMIKQRGIGYGGYHRLKVAVLIDDIATMIVHAMEFELQSDEFLAVRYLVRAWKEQKFTPYQSSEPNRTTENSFLLQYDISYRIRRLEFVISRLGQLYCADDRTRELLRNYDAVSKAGTDAAPHEYMSASETREYKDAERTFREEIMDLQGGLNPVLKDLLEVRKKLNLSGGENPIHEEIAKTKLRPEQLEEIIKEPTDEKRLKAAERLVLRKQVQFDEFAGTLARAIARVTQPAAVECDELLEKGGSVRASYFPEAIAVARHYYKAYDHYDSIFYPILQTTEEGAEFENVEIVRVSPDDCPSIFKEGDGDRRRLAGTALNNFGSFLDRGWRQNDMLWGRLDGAERIITTLLVGTDHESKTRGLIGEAQCAILEEELNVKDQDQLCQLLVRAINDTRQPNDGVEEKLRELVEAENPGNSYLITGLRERLNGEKLRKFLSSKEYKVNEMDRKTAVRSLARSTTVVGKMLEDISAGYSNAGNRIAAWIARFGLLSWGAVEVSVPRSLASQLFRHWLNLFYLFGALLIVLSLVLPMFQTWKLGLGLVAFAAAAHFGSWLLGRFMRGKNLALWLPVSAAAVSGAILLAVGIYALIHDDARAALWNSTVLPELMSLMPKVGAAERATMVILDSWILFALLVIFGLLVGVAVSTVIDVKGLASRGRRMTRRSKRR